MASKEATRKSPRTKKEKVKSDSPDGSVVSKSRAPKKAPKKKLAPPVRKMAPPLPGGTILRGFTKKEWRLGKSIGKGGFGEIYEASSTTAKASGNYVIKVEPQDNGPLFTELSFYRRAATSDSINDWVKSRNLKYLAIPEYIDCGLHKSSSSQYRFLVMERFGDDIGKLFEEAGSKFGVKTVCYLALRILEALEYLHDSEYVHADIKGTNLLTGYSQRDQVYLVDYGLAFRYFPDGEHKPYKPDPRRCHDGTIEFTSIDAHDGASPSRRGDLEILGYCLLQWSCGRLPWEDYIDNKPKVASLKRRYKDAPADLIKDCFKGKAYPKSLQKYMECIYKLSYEETPKYENLRKLFLKELKDNGMRDDGTGLDWIREGGLKGQKRKHDPEPETKSKVMPKAKGRKMTQKETTDIDKDPVVIIDEPTKQNRRKRKEEWPGKDDDSHVIPGAVDGRSKRKRRSHDADDDEDYDLAIDVKRGKHIEASDMNDSSEPAESLSSSRTRRALKRPDPPKRKVGKKTDPEPISDIIPGAVPTGKKDHEDSGPDSPGVEIIPGADSKAGKRRVRKKPNPEPVSDIIPGAEMRKDHIDSDSDSDFEAEPKLSKKALRKKPASSAIIPGVDQNGRKRNHKDSDSDSDFVPGGGKKAIRRRKETSSKAKSAKKQTIDPQAHKIMPAGCYPPELGYKQ